MEVLAELERVAKKTVYMGIIRYLGHEIPPKKHIIDKEQIPLKHLLLKCEDFPNDYEKPTFFMILNITYVCSNVCLNLLKHKKLSKKADILS